jgi:aldehyde dehydrogenase (NAD+)
LIVANEYTGSHFSRAFLSSKFAMFSPVTPDAALANLQATALTARCYNALFRLKQLKSLHDTLRNNSKAIRDAIKQDTHVSDEEATIEAALALDVVKEHYSSIDAKKELDAEYRITNGKDASIRGVPWGVAYVEPHRSHTPFFSAIVTLSAALAAGNCVALKVSFLRSKHDVRLTLM